MKLVDARKSAGLTQSQVADFIGITESGYNLIENEKRGLKPQTAIQLGKLFGVDWAEFYEEGDEHGAIRNDPAGG